MRLLFQRALGCSIKHLRYYSWFEAQVFLFWTSVVGSLWLYEPKTRSGFWARGGIQVKDSGGRSVDSDNSLRSIESKTLKRKEWRDDAALSMYLDIPRVA